MPTWIIAGLRVPCRCWNSPLPALPFAAHAYKARMGVHRPAWSHANQQHNTHYDLDGFQSDSTSGHVGPCQLVQRPADLNGAHPVFLSKSGQKFGWATDTEIKTWFLQLVHPVQGFEYAPRQWSFGTIAPNEIWCHDVGWNLFLQRLICLVSRSRGCQTREWALCFKRVMSLRHDCQGRQIFCRSISLASQVYSMFMLIITWNISG